MNIHSDFSDGAPNRGSESIPKHSRRAGFLERAAPAMLRWALGLTLLSAVADRFGLWGPPGATNVAWGDWSHFVAYTAKVNSFLPGTSAPALAFVATVAEAGLAFALILGVFRRPVALASALLFALFAGAMTVSFGVKAPLNFSVFVDALAAFGLAVWPQTLKRDSLPKNTIDR